jgi:adenylate cyclase
VLAARLGVPDRRTHAGALSTVSLVPDDAEQWSSLGIYDPDAPDADDRLATLRLASARGATTEDLTGAVADGSLPTLIGDLRRRQRRVPLRELAERSGMPLDLAVQVIRAAGFGVASVDEDQFLERDVELFRLSAVAIEMFGLEPSLQFARVTGAALAQIADAAMTNFGQNVQASLDARAASELERAQAGEAASALLFDGVPTILTGVFFHACEDAVRRSATSGAAATSELTVGFLDLVDSIGLAERLAADELGVLISGFERDASERVSAIDGRIVKTLGDEVMFVTTDAASACFVALELAEQVDAHPVLPQLRGGLAAGGLVRGYGDYYGPVVNTAARAVKLAEPGTILVTDEVCRRAEHAPLAFEALGEHKLRGMDRPVALYRVRRR